MKAEAVCEGIAGAPARDLQIAAAARRGETAAFRELYDAYRDRIWSLVLYSVGDPLQAQDVLQTIFLKAYRGLPGFRGESGLFTWLYRIARNECRNSLRRRPAPHMSLDAILGSRDEIEPAGAADAAETSRLLLRDAVSRLPAKMREVLVLRYVEGLSYDEISRTLGCAPGTVASRLNRALAELGDRLRPLRRAL
jgi:RNA polymerase sigma-70 factor, ECF subfamily